MGGGTTTTQTSGLNNKELNQAVSTIGSQLNTQLGKGSAVFDQSMYPGLSSQTQGAADALVNNPLNSGYSSAIGNTLGEFGAIASGQRMGTNAPGYAALRQGLMDDVTAKTNASFQNAGLFGADTNRAQLAENLVSSLGGLDYSNYQNDLARQQQAAQMLPGLYSAGSLPTQAALQAGQIYDADALAARAAEADLFDRMNNAGWNTLQRGTSILSGAAPSAGMTSTSSQQIPWYMTALGIGSGLASFL